MAGGETGAPGNSSGSSGRRFALADQVFELSSKLGALRQRSAADVGALRAAAQGVPELQKAFGPLYAALEAGLVRCHQADRAAVFGRPPARPPSRGLLDPLTAVGNGAGVVGGGCGAGGGGGGTAAAVQHLARVISALEGDVKTAAFLSEHGESFRAIARWARRQSATDSTTTAAATAAAARPAPASALALSRGTAGRSGGIPSPARTTDEEEEEAVERHDPRDDWVLKVFRGRAGPAAAAAAASRTAPLVVVNALRAPLPPLVAPPSPPAPSATGGGGGGAVILPSATASVRGEWGGAHGVSRANSTAARGGAWLNPLSWLSKRGAPRPAGPPPPPPPPPPRTTLPPRVVVRVVYAAAAPDMLERLAVAAERRDDEIVRGRTGSSDGNGNGDGAASDGGGGGGGDGEDGEQRNQGRLPLPSGGSRSLAASGGSSGDGVVLLRSEVRVLDASSRGAACGAREGGGLDGSRRHVVQMQLQVVLQLQTPTPVVVARLLHSGGSVREPVHGVRGSARGGSCGSGGSGGSGGGDGDGDGDAIPSAWGEAPELCPPERSTAEGECELKVGTNHLLGMNVVLPSTTGKPAELAHRARPRRAPGDLPPRSVGAPSPPPRRSSPYKSSTVAVPRAPSPSLPRGESALLGRRGGGGSGGGGGDDGGEEGGRGRSRPVAGHPLQPLQQQQQQQQRRQQRQQQRGEAMDTELAGRSSGKKRPWRELDGGVGGTRHAAGRARGSGAFDGGGGGGSSATVRDASAAAARGVPALGGGGGGSGRETQNESQRGAAREIKRRRRTGWGLGLGFLRLWRRAAQTPIDDAEADAETEADNSDDRTAVAAAAAAAASPPAEASGTQRQPRGEPAHRARGLAAGSDHGQQHGRGGGVRHGAAGHKEGGVSPSSPGPAGGRPCAAGACRGEATGGASSSASRRGRDSRSGDGGDTEGVVPPAAAPLRRSPLVITVVLAPPPASHGLENGRQ